MRKRKVKRYNEGDLVEEDPIGDIAHKAEFDKPGGQRGPVPMPSSEPAEEKEKTFKQAFAAARSSGDKTFMWQGKKYTTELAKSKPDEDERTAERRMTAAGDKWREEKKSRESAAVPKASKEEMDRRKRMEREQALETVSPESNLIGGPGLKLAQKGAKALAASQAAKAAARVPKPRVEPSFRPIKDITPGPEQIRMAPRQIGMKSGGKVSASSRADGAAIRGKTRGRIY